MSHSPVHRNLLSLSIDLSFPLVPLQFLQLMLTNRFLLEDRLSSGPSSTASTSPPLSTTAPSSWARTDDGTFSCLHCGAHLRSVSALRAHLRRHEPNEHRHSVHNYSTTAAAA